MGMAEADTVGATASAQAANPANRKRFIRRLLPLSPHHRGTGKVPGVVKVSSAMRRSAIPETKTN